MKFSFNEAADTLGFFVLRKILCYGGVIVTTGVGIFLINLGEQHKFKPAKVAGVFLILAGFFASFIFLPMVVNKMEANKPMSFVVASKHVLYSYVLMASFVPIVGPYVGRILESERAKNPFAANDE